MNPTAANIVATGLLKGAFDVLDAMLSTSFDYNLGAPANFDEPKAAECLAKFPVIFRNENFKHFYIPIL